MPLSRLQWGRGRMAAEGRGRRQARPPEPRFNGAAAGWPRKAHAPAPRHAHRQLQWGRGRMAAEGLAAVGFWLTPRALQWGRGRMAAEGCAQRAKGGRRKNASMGPRPDGRGRLAVPPARRAAGAASMGPRPDGRGRLALGLHLGRKPLGFNGAAAGWPRKVAAALGLLFRRLLQWGRGRMAAEGCMR